MIISASASLCLWSKNHHGPETDEIVGVKPTQVNRHPHKFSDVPGDWYFWQYCADEDPASSALDPCDRVIDIVQRRAEHIRRFVEQLDGIAQVRFTWDTDNGDGGITVLPPALTAFAHARVSLFLQGYIVGSDGDEPPAAEPE